MNNEKNQDSLATTTTRK